MADMTGSEQATEAVPYDLIIAELEAALHRSTSETVMLRARLAARDRQVPAVPVGPMPREREPYPQVSS